MRQSTYRARTGPRWKGYDMYRNAIALGIMGALMYALLIANGIALGMGA